MYACIYQPPAPDAHDVNRGARGARGDRGENRDPSARSAISTVNALVAIAQEFSPRFERHRDDLVSIDVSGLARLFLRRSILNTPERDGARTLASEGEAPRSVWKTIAEELRCAASARGVRAHVAVAGTRMAALVLAQARPGLTLVEPGEEAQALAPIPVAILEKFHVSTLKSDETSALSLETSAAVSAFKKWGLKTLGELAALPPADLDARLGRSGGRWQAIARGVDVRPLVPMLAEERFESSLDLEWPIEGLEPLSFVLTRLLEPLSTRLERRDRGAAVLHVLLRLVTRETCARRLELPSPMRDVRTLRTLALLDLESHPPAAAIDRVTIVIDPTPGRVLQHTLFTRAHPTPEQLSTLLARLGALMGLDRFGAPATVDSFRPGAFAMTAFLTVRGAPPPRTENLGLERRLSASGEGCRCSVLDTHEGYGPSASASGGGAPREIKVISALRRCRHPVPARVAVADGRPVRVSTERRGFAGGAVVTCVGPWRTCGDWWAPGRYARDEWDVALNDGAVYRIFRDRDTDGWFIDAISD